VGKRNLILLAAFLLGAQGCKWQDDFRSMQQPQYFEQGPRPTLNPDSIDYQGEENTSEKGTSQDKSDQAVSLPAIDNRSTIPEVPEYPAGVEVK